MITPLAPIEGKILLYRSFSDTKDWNDSGNMIDKHACHFASKHKKSPNK
jgi:hypothetical protein